ncbi:MAG: hypothetical protein U5K79_01275 [Cyclobacteriaceae bacterium]|nr:hypothetical protein [Cyclobacteriaceae bacterium]
MWFKVIWPATGKLSVVTKSFGSAIEKSIVFITGPLAVALMEVVCGKDFEIEIISLTNLNLPAKPIYIRAFTYGSEEGSAFSMCASEINCETDTIDAGRASQYMPW